MEVSEQIVVWGSEAVEQGPEVLAWFQENAGVFDGSTKRAKAAAASPRTAQARDAAAADPAPSVDPHGPIPPMMSCGL